MENKSDVTQAELHVLSASSTESSDSLKAVEMTINARSLSVQVHHVTD